MELIYRKYSWFSFSRKTNVRNAEWGFYGTELSEYDKTIKVRMWEWVDMIILMYYILSAAVTITLLIHTNVGY